MQSFRERLASGVLIGDGALGTMLLARGLPRGAPPERWTAERPDALADVARAYAGAGAELITTNTFGANPIRLAQHGIADMFEELNREAVRIARDAARGRAYVSGSIGPTGRLLAPLGDADPAEVAAGYERQAELLVGAGADLICVETMTDLEEALLAVRAVRSASATVPIVASMTFEATPRGIFTVMGVSVERAAAALAAAGAGVVGANCGMGIEDGLAVARAFLACSEVPVIVQPNAGLPAVTKDGLDYPVGPQTFASALAPLAAEGIGILGGCCGTTPAHIRALRGAVESRPSS
jgi:5-methyltetrahydrofolate--homocysteine methyltransferase